MSDTTDITYVMKIDVTPFVRAMHDVGTVASNMAATFAGKPRPPRKPYPKRHSDMTARQYRAARRAYGREMRAYKRTLRTWHEPALAERFRAVAPLFAAAYRAQHPQEEA